MNAGNLLALACAFTLGTGAGLHAQTPTSEAVTACLAAADAAVAGNTAQNDGVAMLRLFAEEDRCLALPSGQCRATEAPAACLEDAAAALVTAAKGLRARLPAAVTGDAAATYARELAAFDAAPDPAQGCTAGGADALSVADCTYFNAAMRLSSLRAMDQLARQLSQEN